MDVLHLFTGYTGFVGKRKSLGYPGKRKQDLHMTATDTNKAIISRHYREIWNAGNLEEILGKLEDTVAPDYLDHNPVPGQVPGLAGLRQVVANLHTALPDMRSEIQ